MTDIEKLAEEYVLKDTSWARNGLWLAEALNYKMAFLAGAEAAKPKWVRCRERMPEPGVWVLVYLCDPGDVRLALWKPECENHYGLWLRYGQQTSIADEVTNWLPLPEPPEDK